MHYRAIVDTHVLRPTHFSLCRYSIRAPRERQDTSILAKWTTYAVSDLPVILETLKLQGNPCSFYSSCEIVAFIFWPCSASHVFSQLIFFFSLLLLFATITLWRFALCSSIGPNTEHFRYSATRRTSSMCCISDRGDDIFMVLSLLKKYLGFFFHFQWDQSANFNSNI